MLPIGVKEDLALQMRQEPDNKIVLDLNRDRIRTVLSEAYRTIKDYLDVDFLYSQQEFVSKIEPYLQSNRVTIPVALDLPSSRYPGTKVIINLRRQRVSVKIHPPSKQATLNHLLGAL